MVEALGVSWIDFTTERRIRLLLRRLSRQRVAMVLQPGGVWVVEKAVEGGREVEADLNTCFMRGWIEPLANAVPTGKLTSPTSMPAMSGRTTIWKLNDSGWYVINRSQLWIMAGLLVAGLSLLVAAVALVVTLLPNKA